MGLILRKMLTGFIYQNLLKQPTSEIWNSSPGKLINLASGDMTLIEMGAYELPYLVTAPLGSILRIYLLYLMVSDIHLRLAVLLSTVFFSSSASSLSRSHWADYLYLFVLKCLNWPTRDLTLLTSSFRASKPLRATSGKTMSWLQFTKHAKQSSFLKFYLAKSLGEGFFRNSMLLFTFPIILVPLSQGKTLEAGLIFPAISLG